MTALNLRNYSVEDLFRLRYEIAEELKRRNFIRSGNNTVSDYAEMISCKAMNLVQTIQSTAGHDATDRQGHKYQIKARTLLKPDGSRQLGAIRGLDRSSDPFDYLIGIPFDKYHNIIRAAKIPTIVVRKRSKFQNHTNSWIFILRDDVWNDPDVTDVTDLLRAAALTSMNQGEKYSPNEEVLMEDVKGSRDPKHEQTLIVDRGDSVLSYTNGDGVRVICYPRGEMEFKELILRNKIVHVLQVFADGTSKRRIWKAFKFKETSDLKWNINTGYASQKYHPGVVEVRCAINEKDLPDP